MKTALFDELKNKLERISETQLADIVSHVNGLLPSEDETYTAPKMGGFVFIAEKGF